MSDTFTDDDNDLDPEPTELHPAERRKLEKRAKQADEATARAARLEKQLAIARNPDLKALNDDQLDVLVDRLSDDDPAKAVELAGKLFNLTPPPPAEQTSPAEQAAHQRIAEAGSGQISEPSNLVDDIAAFNGNEAEFNALMASKGLLVEG